MAGSACGRRSVSSRALSCDGDGGEFWMKGYGTCLRLSGIEMQSCNVFLTRAFDLVKCVDYA